MDELVYPAIMRSRLDWAWGRVAAIDGGTQSTLAFHTQRVWGIVAGLRAMGVAPDDRFAVMANGGSVYADLWQAAAWGGAIMTPVNTRLAPAEVAQVVADCEPTVIFVDDAHAAVVSKLLGNFQVVLLDEADADHDVRLADLLDQVGAAEPPADPASDDPVLLLYTGGTTGRAKGVVHTQRSICLGIYRTHFLWELCDPDVCFYQATPMFHISGFHASLSVRAGGGRTVFRPAFDPGQTIADIADFGVTHIPLVPTMLAMIFDHPSFSPEKLSSLRRIAYGGSAMPLPLLQRVREALPDVHLAQSYGMTEALGAVTILSPAEHRQQRALASVGLPMLGVELRIEGPDGLERAAGEVGEICVRSGSVMTGYWRNRPATDHALRGGWYHTGDLGYLDPDGYLHVVDRLDDMIVSGGENVYSSEVEAALVDHPDVLQVAVVGLPDPRWGSVVHAVVVRRPGSALDQATLVAHARERIAGYKVPRSVEFRDDPLPLSGTAKVQKNLLRSGPGLTSAPD